MNKFLSASEIDVPPLLLLILAVTSLVFNLCFPQYSAYASTGNLDFIRENELRENTIALNKLQKEIEERKIASAQNVQSAAIYSETAQKRETVAKKTVKVAAKTAPKAAAQSAVGNTGSVSSRWVTVTAYSSTVQQCDASPFITASGTHVRDGVIATNLLAFGTKVKFPGMYGDKIFTVEDRMNARFSNRADIWFATLQEAKQFGVRKLEMIIVS